MSITQKGIIAWGIIALGEFGHARITQKGIGHS
jgi:hypothetical protein